MIRKGAIQDWNVFVENGTKYYETSKKMLGGKKKFSGDIVYNILAMSIENNLVGALMCHGAMPESHILGDMLSEIKKLKDVGSLEEKIRKMDSFQEICSIDLYNRRTPTEEDLVEMLDTAGEVRELTESLVNQ